MEEYLVEITQNSDLAHEDMLKIANGIISYCCFNLKEDIEINKQEKYRKNYEDLKEIFNKLEKNILEHNNL